MSRIFMHTTRSMCPQCGKIVDAKVFTENSRVYMEKFCHEHGTGTALISGDYNYYSKSHEFIKPGQLQRKYFSAVKTGCPHDCGLCNEHEQHICSPIIEITGRCNLACPICIAEEKNREDLSFDDLKRMVEQLLESEGRIDVLNLSGGEPTLHKDYMKIIEYLSSIDEITTVSVSTNGLTFLENDGFIEFHKSNRVLPSLQFDGCSDEVYEKLRGSKLLGKKEKIIAKFIEHDLSFTLIAVIARGINDNLKNFRCIYDLFIKNENILSLMFQPLVYNSRLGYNVMDRVTIPDVIKLVAQGSAGTLSEDDFMPLPCSNANCFALAHMLKVEGGGYLPFKQFINQERYISIIKNKSLFGTDEESFYEIQDLIFDLWSDSGNPEMCPCMADYSRQALQSVKSIIKEVQRNNDDISGSKKSFNTGSRKIKSVYIHHFMDADTFDITRVRRCCTVYPKPDGKFYPLCSYNNMYRERR